MTNLPSVKIKTDGCFARIFIDGKEVRGVRCYRLEHNRNGTPVLALEMVCGEIVSDVSSALIEFAPTSNERGREQDEADFGWTKAISERSE